MSAEPATDAARARDRPADAPLIDIRSLTRRAAHAQARPSHPVNDVSLTLAPEETLGLVGESRLAARR